MHKSCLHARS